MEKVVLSEIMLIRIDLHEFLSKLLEMNEIILSVPIEDRVQVILFLWETLFNENSPDEIKICPEIYELHYVLLSHSMLVPCDMIREYTCFV